MEQVLESTIKVEWDLQKHYFKSLDDPKIQKGVDKDLKQLDEFIEKYKGKITSLSDKDF